MSQFQSTLDVQCLNLLLCLLSSNWCLLSALGEMEAVSTSVTFTMRYYTYVCNVRYFIRLRALQYLGCMRYYQGGLNYTFSGTGKGVGI